MNQLSAFFKRAPLLCAASILAASVCPAQNSASDKRGTQPGGAQKAAAPDKDKSAASKLDEDLSAMPGGKTVAKFFAAFNSGEIEAMRRFHETYGGSEENAEQDLNFFKQTGGLKPHSVTRPAKDQIVVLSQTKNDGRWIAFGFTLAADEPHAIQSLNVRPASAPEASSH